MEQNQKEWYEKLLSKLKKIESGEMKLGDYIVEVEEKLGNGKPEQPKEDESEKWTYFFGITWNGSRTNCYQKLINGVRCEKMESGKYTKFCIGNMDSATEKFDTEEELVKKVMGIKEGI